MRRTSMRLILVLTVMVKTQIKNYRRKDMVYEKAPESDFRGVTYSMSKFDPPIWILSQ